VFKSDKVVNVFVKCLIDLKSLAPHRISMFFCVELLEGFFFKFSCITIFSVGWKSQVLGRLYLLKWEAGVP
jgi:hypothetical protein